MAMTKKGFTLIETLISAMILTIVGSGIAGIYVLESGLLTQTAHRLEAVNYARSTAETLIDAGKREGDDDSMKLLLIGTHTAETDPEACSLPDCYFKTRLNGKLSYAADDVTLENNITARRVTIIVEWQEKFPKVQNKKEELVTAA